MHRSMSIGNDIIALAETDDTKTSLYRFYSRILTPDEHALSAATSLPFSTFVWLLWSIKESAYKYVSRSNQQLVFAPLKILVKGLSSRRKLSSREDLSSRGDLVTGTVCYGGVTLFSRSFVRKKVIMTIVNGEEDFGSIRWGVHVVGDSRYTTQSAAVREMALSSLSSFFPGAALQIVKTPDGPPGIRDGDRSLDIPLSLAHHGRYVAWSFRLPANSSSYRKSPAN